MKLKGDALKIVIALPLIIAFIIYASIYQNRQKTKFNQFINGYEGKSFVIQYLFHLEGIDKAIIEQHMKSNSIPILNRDLDTDYRIEKLIQYALQELKVSEGEIDQLTRFLDASPKFNISDTFVEEYIKATNLDEKIALIKVVLENESEIWNK